jgi:ATP-dependent Clp protease protease subunit
MTKKNLYDEPLTMNVAATKKIETPEVEKEFEQDVYKEFEFGFNSHDSIIYLHGDIQNGNLFDIVSKCRMILKYRPEEDAEKPITVLLNSNGGDVYEALGIIDYFETLQVPVNVVARGRAMSAAAMILCSASGVRAASKNTTIMLHEASAEIYGKTADLKANADHIDELEDSFYKMLATKSNQTEEFWIKACRKDFYMTAAKALEYGLIDQII